MKKDFQRYFKNKGQKLQYPQSHSAIKPSKNSIVPEHPDDIHYSIGDNVHITEFATPFMDENGELMYVKKTTIDIQ